MIAAAGCRPWPASVAARCSAARRCPGIATAVVVPDRRPAISMGVDMLRDVGRAEAHDTDYQRGSLASSWPA